MPQETLFQGRDHIDRRWLITARPGPDAVAIVTFTCWNTNGRSKALDQTAAWSPDGWDMCRRWFPASPRPVPDLILAMVQKKLQELVK